MKITQAALCASFIGNLFIIHLPAKITGIFAINIPRVVPAMTATVINKSVEYLAASMTVAIWVLSPISAIKNRNNVDRKGP